LGWIEYRAGNWQLSIESLEKSCKLQKGGTGDEYQWIFLAMAQWQLGHKDEARKWYKQSIQSVKIWPKNLRSVRAEAEELLCVKEKNR